MTIFFDELLNISQLGSYDLGFMNLIDNVHCFTFDLLDYACGID